MIQVETRQCYEDLEVGVASKTGKFVVEKRVGCLKGRWDACQAGMCLVGAAERVHVHGSSRHTPAVAAGSCGGIAHGVTSRLRPAHPAHAPANLLCLPALPCLALPPSSLQAVLSVPGVDCCFMGPVDLSHALGLAQSLGFPACFDSPQFKARPVCAVCALCPCVCLRVCPCVRCVCLCLPLCVPPCVCLPKSGECHLGLCLVELLP